MSRLSVDAAAPGALQFRAWSAGDLDDLVRHANNPRVWMNLKTAFPHPFTPEWGRQWIDARLHPDAEGSAAFAIALDRQVIGEVAVDVDPGEVRTGTIHFWLGEAFWGRGIGGAAARFIIGHAWTALGLDRLQALVFDWNEPSAKILRNCGFAREGRLRQAVRKGGRLGDLLVFGLLRAEMALVGRPDNR